jgi:hypothetical protein
MKDISFVIVLGVIVSAAAPAHERHGGEPLITAKSVEQFAGCFADAQDQASRAWWFVPRSNGGTFSNLGAKGVRSPYFLAVLDRGGSREIRLERDQAAAPADRVVVRAVDECV